MALIHKSNSLSAVLQIHFFDAQETSEKIGIRKGKYQWIKKIKLPFSLPSKIY